MRNVAIAQPSRDRGEHRRRLKRRNYADQVAEKHEDEQGTRKCHVFRAIVVADDFFRLLTLEIVNEFEQVLQFTRLIDGKARRERSRKAR